jgi:hypothetical protein
MLSEIVKSCGISDKEKTFNDVDTSLSVSPNGVAELFDFRRPDVFFLSPPSPAFSPSLLFLADFLPPSVELVAGTSPTALSDDSQLSKPLGKRKKSWGQCYKTFYARKLGIFVIS